MQYETYILLPTEEALVLFNLYLLHQEYFYIINEVKCSWSNTLD